MSRKKYKNIYQTKDGRWYYSKMIRGYRYVKYFDTAHEAYDALCKITSTMIQNGNKDMSFPLFLKDYQSYMTTKYEITSCISKEYIINKHILPFFEKMKISEINAFILKQWRYNFIIKNAKLSINHKNHVINLCKLIMKYLQENYFYLTGYEQLIKVKENVVFDEKAYWDFKTYHCFNQVVQNTQDQLAFHLLFYYGLRLGELLGLQWKCIDWEKKIIKIYQQKVNDRHSHKQVLKAPKTKTSRRIIYLTDATVTMLKSQQKEREDFIIPVSRTTLRRRFNQYQKEAQVPFITIHQLRHSCITNMYYSDNDVKAIGQMVGHSNQTMTFYYTHQKDEAIIQLVNSLEEKMKS